MKNKREIGNEGEDLAVEFLEKKGYEIIERNYRYGRGEIDIIAKDDDVLVFVEVKLRKNLEFGPPEAAFTAAKQKQVRRVAELYLGEHEIKDTVCRMDAVAIQMLFGKVKYINHMENAF